QRGEEMAGVERRRGRLQQSARTRGQVGGRGGFVECIQIYFIYFTDRSAHADLAREQLEVLSVRASHRRIRELAESQTREAGRRERRLAVRIEQPREPGPLPAR